MFIIKQDFLKLGFGFLSSSSSFI